MQPSRSTSARTSSHCCAATSSHPSLRTRRGGWWGQRAACASSAPAPRIVLAEPWSAPSPQSRSWGANPPPPAPPCLLQRVWDGHFPTTAPGKGVIWCGLRWPAAGQAREAAGYPAPQRSPGNQGWGGGEGGGEWTEEGEISAAEMQSPLSLCTAHATAAGTQPLRAPEGLFCRVTPRYFPTPWQGQGASAGGIGSPQTRGADGGPAWRRGWECGPNPGAPAGGDWRARQR